MGRILLLVLVLVRVVVIQGNWDLDLRVFDLNLRVLLSDKRALRWRRELKWTRMRSLR